MVDRLGRDGAGGAAGGTLSRRRDRDEPVPVARDRPDGERVLTFVNETFERIAKERSFYSDALMREIAKRGSLHGIPGVPEEAGRIFKTSHEVSYDWHVRHQAAFQRYTDNGVSKTIN